MAGKRIASSSINWGAIAERVPENQKVQFLSLKSKSDGYLRRVLANPEKAPKIDWSHYKSKVPVAGLVDTFQKQYDAFKVPYPADKLTSEVVAQEKQAEVEIKEFCQKSALRIKAYEATIAKWDDVLPFEEMTIEDYKDAFPDRVLDPINKPTHWPHTAEEQIQPHERKAMEAH